MKFDDYLNLIPEDRAAVYQRLPEHQRGVLHGEVRARQAQLEAREAALVAEIQGIYAACAAKPSTIEAAAERGITPDEMAVRILGPMRSSRQGSNFVEDEDNPAIRQLREALK